MDVKLVMLAVLVDALGVLIKIAKLVQQAILITQANVLHLVLQEQQKLIQRIVVALQLV